MAAAEIELRYGSLIPHVPHSHHISLRFFGEQWLTLIFACDAQRANPVLSAIECVLFLGAGAYVSAPRRHRMSETPSADRCMVRDDGERCAGGGTRMADVSCSSESPRGSRRARTVPRPTRRSLQPCRQLLGSVEPVVSENVIVSATRDFSELRPSRLPSSKTVTVFH